MAQDTKSQPAHGGGVAYGVTSLVTGIVALLLGWFAWFRLPLGAIAIVFGALGIKRPDSKGLAIAGLITGAIGAFIGLVVTFIFILAVTVSAPSTPTYYDNMPMLDYRN
jgi:hypothetical protein